MFYSFLLGEVSHSFSPIAFLIYYFLVFLTIPKTKKTTKGLYADFSQVCVFLPGLFHHARVSTNLQLIFFFFFFHFLLVSFIPFPSYFQKQIGIFFNNEEILKKTLTHPSIQELYTGKYGSFFEKIFLKDFFLTNTTVTEYSGQVYLSARRVGLPMDTEQNSWFVNVPF